MLDMQFSVDRVLVHSCLLCVFLSPKEKMQGCIMQTGMTKTRSAGKSARSNPGPS